MHARRETARMRHAFDPFGGADLLQSTRIPAGYTSILWRLPNDLVAYAPFVQGPRPHHQGQRFGDEQLSKWRENRKRLQL